MSTRKHSQFCSRLSFASLRASVKGFSAEGKSLRKNAKKRSGDALRAENEFITGLGQKARAAHVAYSLLRGRLYNQMEGTSKQAIDHGAVFEVIKRTLGWNWPSMWEHDLTKCVRQALKKDNQRPFEDLLAEAKQARVDEAAAERAKKSGVISATMSFIAPRKPSA